VIIDLSLLRNNIAFDSCGLIKRVHNFIRSHMSCYLILTLIK